MNNICAIAGKGRPGADNVFLAKTGADRRNNTLASGSFAMTIRWMAAVFIALLAGFGACTNGTGVRPDPLHRAVFNYLVGYEFETDAVVRYPVRLRRMPVRQIAAVALQGPHGDAGFAGVPKAVRALSADESAIVRFNHKRNTLDVDVAVKQMKARTVLIEAVVMVPNYRTATKSIEKTHDLFPGMIYTDVPGMQGTALGPQLDTEKLIDVPANLRNPDLDVGTALNFGPADLQISPKVWGNAA
jgi:hypothetical protein